ncbi:hypothetical protein AcW1_005054 [Taiwanofungus camphoratus]|nr:hypothetical protein AcW2_005937 [Antrodia cinnamomea]KAI0940293.1 hypothetical protein AcV5_001439 [Antrodia cinnamomea]KAI0941163.1 hypothetical protein AcV7_002805 [Antrodia cinnamomea]KAI0960575.1 hypothetical protein AcW1_005054 [Antrodia cinnamomea]
MATETVSQAKPSSPPPAYTELPDSANRLQSSSVHTPTDSSNLVPSTSFPTHAGYGPTPIAQQTQLLPYYDPRSPHSIAEAGARARWRFVAAILWALGILAFASFVMGYEVHLRVHGVRIGSWLYPRNSDAWSAQ